MCHHDIQSHMSPLGYGYIGARTDTTQQSGQTPDGEVEIKNITVYVSGYTETDTTGMLSPPTAWRFSVAADIDSNVFEFHFLIWSLSRLLCCVGSGFNVAAALHRLHVSPQTYTEPSLTIDIYRTMCHYNMHGPMSHYRHTSPWFSIDWHNPISPYVS